MSRFRYWYRWVWGSVAYVFLRLYNPPARWEDKATLGRDPSAQDGDWTGRKSVLSESWQPASSFSCLLRSLEPGKSHGCGGSAPTR